MEDASCFWSQGFEHVILFVDACSRLCVVQVELKRDVLSFFDVDVLLTLGFVKREIYVTSTREPASRLFLLC